MKSLLPALFTTLSIYVAANAETENFDRLKPGAIGSPWIVGVTGKGEVSCEVVADSEAPSKPQVLKQTKEGTFPYCVKKNVSIENGFVEVKFKAISGNEDAAGGLVWRFKDGNNYYVARANALEDNVSLYYTGDGKRKTIKYTEAPVPKDKWHLLRVEFHGQRIKVLLNGKTYIELDDDHIKGPGAVGVWTKADSVTAFDDFNYENSKTAGTKK
jgi:hypothetical protein